MSRKQVLEPYAVIEDGDMSGNITSSTTNTKNKDDIYYEVSWSGSSPVGTITVEAQVNDQWQALDFGGDIDVSGNTGSHTISIGVPFNALRLKYNFTSGTGTLQAYVSGKTVGA